MNLPNFPKVNFIGNKERLADWICSFFPPDAKSVFDAFSGGGSVGYEAKKRGYKVITNDILRINSAVATALIENKNETLTEKDIRILLEGTPIKGFMYKHYANVFFYPEECKELDLYRRNVEKLSSEYKQSLALALLRRAMIRKMPYSRFTLDWDTIRQLRNESYSYRMYGRKRAYHNQSFKEHVLENLDNYNAAVFDNGQKNISYNKDIFDLLGTVQADVIYLDPPYSGTMNNYFGFYGVLDEFVLSKKLQPFENNFINKKNAIVLFDKLFSRLESYPYWFLSYNNSSFPAKEDLLALLKKYDPTVKMIEKPHQYKVTGKGNKSLNTEYLFIVQNRVKKPLYDDILSKQLVVA